MVYDLDQMRLVCTLALVVLALGCGGGGLSPDVIYTNGVVVTMKPDLPRAEAIAVCAGSIAAVGSSTQIDALAVCV